MVTYILLFLSIILVSLLVFYKGETKRRKIIFLIISFGLMFLIMGFREVTVGTDTSLYCTIFKNNSNYPLSVLFNGTNTSFVYSLYNKLVSLISTDCRAIIISNSLIICALTALFIYKNSKNVVFPTLFFMTFYHFFSAMNISRQYIAVLIVANAFYFLKQRKIFKYILLCTIATLVHNTAIVSFALLPFLFIKPTKRNIFLYLSILTVGMLFLDKILILFSSIFGHYDMYFDNGYLTQVGENRKIIITLIYIVFALLLTNLLRKNNNVKKDLDIYLLYLINFIAIIIGILSLKIMLLSRIEIYFSIFAIILIPKIFDMMKNRLFYYFIFIIIMFIPMYMQLSSNNSEVLPYLNWLF